MSRGNDAARRPWPSRGQAPGRRGGGSEGAAQIFFSVGGEAEAVRTSVLASQGRTASELPGVQEWERLAQSRVQGRKCDEEGEL